MLHFGLIMGKDFLFWDTDFIKKKLLIIIHDQTAKFKKTFEQTLSKAVVAYIYLQTKKSK